MSSETRIVRPYLGGAEFQAILDLCQLQGADKTVEGGGEIVVGLDDYLNYPFSLQMDVDWGTATKGAEALGISPSDIDFLVLMVAPRLRFVDTVFRCDLESIDEIPTELRFTGNVRPRALRAPHGGADLRIYFCLNKSLEPRPVRPWRHGTWLAQQEFRIRSELTGGGFVPIRMTDDDRGRLGLHRDTVRFVTLDDADPFDTELQNDVVKLYVDGELLDRLAVAASTTTGRLIQLQLFIDAISAIAFDAQRRLRNDPQLRQQHVDDFRGSLVHRLTELIAGRSSDSASQELRHSVFLQLCDNPVGFIAQVEAKYGMKKHALESLGDPQ